MKYIALIAVIAVVLLQATGAQSSFGGTLTMGLVFLSAALAVGIHDAWSKKRGVLGWIVSIVASLAGGLLVFSGLSDLVDLVIVLILALLSLAGSSLTVSGPTVSYFAPAGMMLLTLGGSWAALWIVNRWR